METVAMARTGRDAALRVLQTAHESVQPHAQQRTRMVGRGSQRVPFYLRRAASCRGDVGYPEDTAAVSGSQPCPAH